METNRDTQVDTKVEKRLLRVVVQPAEHERLVGDWSEPLTADQVSEGKDIIKDNWSGLAYLSLVVGEDEIIIPAEVLHRSILTFEVSEVGCDS